MNIAIRLLTADDIGVMNAMRVMFGEAFEDLSTYTEDPPGENYLRRLLDGDSFIALAALLEDEVVGGIAAYELMKYEKERSEIYLYDLAVAASHRRMGIASALIDELRIIAADRGAHLIFVQADTGVEDEPAITLYTRLGSREDVLHFDISVSGESGISQNDGTEK